MPNVRRRGTRRAALAAVAMILLSACNPNRFVSGWVPYWNAPQGRVGFNSAASQMFTDISPFFFTALADGTIGLTGSKAELDKTVLDATARGIKVLPSITDGSGKLTMATGILLDPARRTQHVQNIVALVVGSGFDGIDLDYEGFAFADGAPTWDATKPLWIAFITELANTLHANGKLLSVTIPPTWMEAGGVRGYPVYAPAEIGAVADRVRLMVYDWSVANPGPISPMSWVNLVIAYNGPLVPHGKLQLGIPSYGRDWGRKVNAAEICPDGALATRSIELDNMQGVIAAHGSPVLTRDATGEVTFSYDVVATGYSTTPIPAPPYVRPVNGVPSVGNPAASTGLQPALRLTPPTVQLSCTVRHFVHYGDAITIQMHAQAALNAGWSGVVLWAMGYETREVYDALAMTTPAVLP
ncbi:MAG TPA: glycosyl hydrolase family 18 protein [Ilumatobacteraceae bacterium]